MIFDISNMPYKVESDGKPRYFFTFGSRLHIQEDVSTLNLLLKELDEHIEIPNIGMKGQDISFEPNPKAKGPISYSFLWDNSLTPYGKLPKYVSTAYLTTGYRNYEEDWKNITMAQIYYLMDGSIGKTRMVMWRDAVLFVAHFKNYDGKLQVRKISEGPTYEETILYQHFTE